MDDNPYRSPTDYEQPAVTPATSAPARRLRAREVFVISSALMFLGMMLLPLLALESPELKSVRIAFGRAQRQDNLLGWAILASHVGGLVCALLWKVAGDLRRRRRSRR